MTIISDKSIFNWIQKLESSDSPIILSEIDGTIIFSNQEANDLFDYETDELINQNNSKLNAYHLEDISLIQACVSKYGVWRGNRIFKKKDSKEFLAYVKIEQILDSDDKPAALMHQFALEESRNEYEAELAFKQEQLDAIIKNSNAVISYVDKDRKFIELNNACVEFNKSRIHKSPAIGDNLYDFVLSEEYERTKQAIDTAFSGQEISSQYEMKFQEDGPSRLVSVKYCPLYKYNEVEAIGIFIQDITYDIAKDLEFSAVVSNKSKWLNQIQIQEAQYSAIVNNTNAIMISIDREYNLITFNVFYQDFIEKLFNKTPKKGDYVLAYVRQVEKEYLISIYERTFSGEKVDVVLNYFDETLQVDKSLEACFYPIYSNNEIVALSIMVIDVSEKKQYALQLEQALKEKEFLLNEIHHRVKNNLAIISSLLKLEELVTEKQDLKDILISSQNRIKSTALVHQFLYQNDSIQKIAFIDYIKEFINQAKGLLVNNDEIEIEVFGDEFLIDIELATPCGLIINELLTNSIKHAFDKSIKHPKISVIIHLKDNFVELIYKDNGIGFSIDEAKNNSLGMTIVHTLVKQIKGKENFRNNEGTIFELAFPFLST